MASVFTLFLFYTLAEKKQFTFTDHGIKEEWRMREEQ